MASIDGSHSFLADCVFTKIPLHAHTHVIILLLTLMRLLAFRESAEVIRDAAHSVFDIVCVCVSAECVMIEEGRS